MPRGNAKCYISGCEFETSGDFPETGIERSYVYFTQRPHLNTFNDSNLAESVIKHHLDTQIKNADGSINSIGHAHYNVSLEGGKEGHVTAHTGVMTYKLTNPD